MAGTRESTRRLFPHHFTTFVRADRRHHLIVLRGQHKHVVFGGRDGPTRNMFGHDLLREWLRSTQFRNVCDVEPLLTRRRQSRAQKTKRRAAERGKYGGENTERQQLQKRAARSIRLICIYVHSFNPWLILYLTRLAQLFFPAVAISHGSRQNNFRITEIFPGQASQYLYSEPEVN